MWWLWKGKVGKDLRIWERLGGVTEKAMAPHSSTLAWKIPWMDEPGGLHSMGLWNDWADTTERTSLSRSCIGEGNGNPLQCFCLENPREGGAWWAAVYGVAQSRTRLKRLSSSSSNPVYIFGRVLAFIFNHSLCRHIYCSIIPKPREYLAQSWQSISISRMNE